MKIITRAVLDWNGNILEEESFEYSGPIAACKDSGSPPQPVDPYTQANAQLGLSEGTAGYNAALNRTSSSNPVGTSGWQISGYDPKSGAPIYNHSTDFGSANDAMLRAPINSYNIVGDQGVGAAVGNAQKAAYGQEMGYLQPQEQQQTEQLDSQLANEGIMPGSAAYDYAKQSMGRQQTFSNQQAADSAIGAGNSELSTLSSVGGQQLQNELAARNAPIQEFNDLSSGGSTGISASTPDISGAFGQQYQGALAGYNANTATNNANDQAAGSAAMLALMYAY